MDAISIGEVLWDLVGTAEHLGGAAFNFALHLRNLGHSVHFVSAVGSDERGKRVLEYMKSAGLATDHVPQLAGYKTGTASVVLDANGQPYFVIEHPAAYDFTTLRDEEIKRLCSGTPDLVYFGTLFQMSPSGRHLTLKIIEKCSAARRFYDVNLRAESYGPELVRKLMSLASIVKINDDEVRAIRSMFADRSGSLEHFCRDYTHRFGWEAVCVTRGPQGCVLLVGDSFVSSPGYKVSVVDAIGAGDAFAAALAHGLVANWEPRAIADFANRVGALVASRPGATPQWTFEEAAALRQ